ncbi:MAG: hypothetical protein GYA33_05245 [Thermogutta sp.]|nr:hypothetical protein [Thermogutta sp.]
MVPLLDLSQNECALLLELLERERADLHCEIRHTRFADVRDVLREKRCLVEALLNKIQQTSPEVSETQLDPL